MTELIARLSAFIVPVGLLGLLGWGLDLDIAAMTDTAMLEGAESVTLMFFVATLVIGISASWLINELRS